MGSRTCISSGTGAGSRGLAAGLYPTSARIRLIFSTGGLAPPRNRSWPAAAMIITKTTTGMTMPWWFMNTSCRKARLVHFIRCRPRRAPAVVILKCSWAMKAPSRCRKSPASAGCGAKTVPPSPGTSWPVKITCSPLPPRSAPTLTRWTYAKRLRCCNMTFPSPSPKKSTSRIWKISSTPFAARLR